MTGVPQAKITYRKDLNIWMTNVKSIKRLDKHTANTKMKKEKCKHNMLHASKIGLQSDL